jgi:hypothetical protein
VDARIQNALAVLTRPPAAAPDHLERARRLLERAVRQRWADGMLSHDGNGGYAAPAAPLDIERMIRAPGPTVDAVDDFAYAPDSAIGDLARRLGLAPTQADLFAVLLACETDPTAARIASYLTGNTASGLTVDTLFEIVYRPRPLGDATLRLHAELAPEGPARGLRFVVVDGADTRSFLGQGVRLHPRLTAWLLGRHGVAPELGAAATLVDPDDAPAVPGDAEHAEPLAQLRHALEARGQLAVLHGAAGAGRELLVRAAARACGRPLLLIRARGLEPGALVAAFRDAVLHGAVLAFADAEELFAGDGAPRLRACLALYGGTVVLMGVGGHVAQLAAMRPTVELTLALPPYARRLALWRHHLGAAQLSDAEWHEVSGLYNLGIGGISRAAAAARTLAAPRPVGRAHVAQAVRQLFETDLATVARRVDVTQTWDDVVLPPDVVDAIVAIVDRVALRNEVLGDWGFGRKVGKGLGVTALFSGQPGTGKSMVAGLIARELGLDLYVIDLSRIASKWIGETEKNLARAFDAAEAGHVLLLFDEADSILGKRTVDVKSANDRHANLETNFILARLEQFHGVAIFTTNIASAIDPAISRRMSANILFPFPDLESRAELWRKMIPAEAPVAPAIDFVRLARTFELSGGFIRNVVLRAAFLAAREHRPISTDHLERSAHGEYGDRGALTSGGRLT